MSIEQSTRPNAQLTPTSYLVLGLIAREGPSTPYDLERHVAATIGHFWSFPHVLLYREPPRLAELGLLAEERELQGRRRRLFTITDTGRGALRAWLGRPSREPTELRDPAMLQLFFADLEPTSVRLNIAREQLEVHRAQMAGYEAGQRSEGGFADRQGAASRSVEYWRELTLPMGLLYERAVIEFWEGIVAGVAAKETAADRARAEDDGASIAPAQA